MKSFRQYIAEEQNIEQNNMKFKIDDTIDNDTITMFIEEVVDPVAKRLQKEQLWKRLTSQLHINLIDEESPAGRNMIARHLNFGRARGKIDIFMKQFRNNTTNAYRHALLHELSHQIYFEWDASGRKREKVQNKFKELIQIAGNSEEETLNQKAREMLDSGNIIVYRGKESSKVTPGDRFEILEISDKISIQNVETEKKLNAPISRLINGDWALETDKGEQSIPNVYNLEANIDTNNWFPTDYSKEDADEWFSDLFTFWALGNIKGEPAEWMEKMIDIFAA